MTGEPGRLAAVLALKDEIWYTDMATPVALLSCLSPRSDNQIMAREQMAVLLALHTFREQVAMRLWRQHGRQLWRSGAACAGRSTDVLKR